MDDTDRRAALRLWALATFHTAGFVIAIVIAVHLSGTLQTALSRLNTEIGFVIFLLLWAITWFATRLGLRKMEPSIDDAPAATIVFTTTVAGAWNGVGIWMLILLAGILALAYQGGRAIALVPILFFSTVIGSLLAFAVGAVVGFAFGLVDALLVRVGAALVSSACSARVQPSEHP